MTHQDIIDRIEALRTEHGKAYLAEQARIDKERASLQELCGGLGHFFRHTSSPYLLVNGRLCVFCDAVDPGSVHEPGSVHVGGFWSAKG